MEKFNSRWPENPGSDKPYREEPTRRAVLRGLLGTALAGLATPSMADVSTAERKWSHREINEMAKKGLDVFREFDSFARPWWNVREEARKDFGDTEDEPSENSLRAEHPTYIQIQEIFSIFDQIAEGFTQAQNKFQELMKGSYWQDAEEALNLMDTFLEEVQDFAEKANTTPGMAEYLQQVKDRWQNQDDIEQTAYEKEA